MNTHPHELAPLLLALGRAGIELAAHGDRLRHRPADLSPDVSARLRIHRASVLALLVDSYAPDPDSDAGYVYAERLGVADALAMPTHHGSAAWLVALGESMGTGCEIATYGVHSEHGSTDEGHSGGGTGERPNALRDRQGRGSGP